MISTQRVGIVSTFVTMNAGNSRQQDTANHHSITTSNAPPLPSFSEHIKIALVVLNVWLMCLAETRRGLPYTAAWV